MRYRFKKIETAEEILKEIGRTDIPPNKVIIRRPAIDEETGEVIADIEIEILDEYPLSSTDEKNLIDLMLSQGLKLKEKR